jgi:sugar lactone lactonase YvrE
MSPRFLHLFLVMLLAVSMFLSISCGDDDDDDDSGDDDDSSDDDDDSTDDDDDAGDDDDDDDDDTIEEVPLPVTPELFVDGAFSSTEGICFNNEGRMFVEGDNAVHEVFANGTHNEIASLVDPIGLAHDGNGNILVAEFGPTSVFDIAPHDNDGSIVEVTPAGATQTLATGIADPNFIALFPDKSFLVSDDGTTNIYKLPQGGGTPTIWLDSIVTPNGMTFSTDMGMLFVNQSFKAAGGIIPDNRVWQVALDQNGDPGQVELLATLPGLATPDGSVLDAKGRLYVAANTTGVIWRIDPLTKVTLQVATGMLGVASLAFGRGGDFPTTSMYATNLFNGKVWKLDLGVHGAELP